MSRSLASVERETLVTHLVNNWKRTRLLTFARNVTVPDPGHGHDVISPIIYLNQPMNPDSDGDVGAISPFTARDIRGFQEGATTRLGVGWLVVAVGELRDRTIIPGDPPVKLADVVLSVWIAAPSIDGTETPDNYTGAVVSIFESQFFEPGEAGIEEIRQTGPLPQRATHLADDEEGWSWHQLDIPFKRTWKGSGQPTQGG